MFDAPVRTGGGLSPLRAGGKAYVLRRLGEDGLPLWKFSSGLVAAAVNAKSSIKAKGRSAVPT